MKKKILLSFVSVFVLCTSFILPVSATDVYLEDYDPFENIVDDTQYYGSFNGKEYPIIPQIPGMSYFYDIEGFAVTNYVYVGTSSTYFNQVFTSENNKYYQFRVNFLPAERCTRNQTYDIRFHFTTNLSVDAARNAVLTYNDMSYSNAGSFTNGVVKAGSGSFYIEFTDVVFNVESPQWFLYFYGTSTSTSSSLVCSGVSVKEVPKDISVDLGNLSGIMENIGLNVNEIGVNVIAIRDYCISLIEAINLNFGILHEKIDGLKSSMISKLDEVKTSINTIGSDIVASVNGFSSSVTGHFNSLNTWIQNQTASITSKLNDLLVYFKGNEQSNSSVDNNNQSSNNANDTFSDYNDIESGYMDSMNESLGSIDTNNNLFGMGDFVKTGSFVSTQLENIYNSNVIIQNVIMYGLILGLSLTVIGISTKRG